MNPANIEEAPTGRKRLASDIQSHVMAELELILAAPSFVQSNRCKNFLRFVVLETLAGNASQLKERTIGINVFQRAVDYDTGGDSIVRVTSNEVRKRIDQFYRESEAAHPIQIELLRGSYVPEFRIRQTKQDIEPPPAMLLAAPIVEQGPYPAAEILEASPLRSEQVSEQITVPTQNTTAQIGHRHRKSIIAFALLGLCVTGAIITLFIWRDQAKNRTPSIWDAFQRAHVPILICLGTHNLSASGVSPTSGGERFADTVLHKETIPLDDVTVITSMASLLGEKGIPFRVAGARQTSLTDLRRQPVILIGAADNWWTLRISQDLRYKITYVPRGENQVPIASIVDSSNPPSAPWTFDFSIPMNQWKVDYGIVAKVDDPTTGVPVLIDAGLGNDGSLATSELISSNVLPKELAAEPHCSGKSNFEAVVQTDIIDAKPGPPHVIRLECW